MSPDKIKTNIFFHSFMLSQIRVRYSISFYLNIISTKTIQKLHPSDLVKLNQIIIQQVQFFHFNCICPQITNQPPLLITVRVNQKITKQLSFSDFLMLNIILIKQVQFFEFISIGQEYTNYLTLFL
jgi:hypothetical protein